MTTFSYTCRDGHTPIGFNVLAPDDDERCPLCLLRDEITLEQESCDCEIVDLHSYPYTEEAQQ